MKILISALEPSANLHLEPLFARLGEIEKAGIFSNKYGTPIYDSKLFSVMGFVEVIGKIPLARKALKAMVDQAKDSDLVLLIDSPAFNVPLAKAIKKSLSREKDCLLCTATSMGMEEKAHTSSRGKYRRTSGDFAV